MICIYEFVCLIRVYPVGCVQLWSGTLSIDAIDSSSVIKSIPVASMEDLYLTLYMHGLEL